MAESDKTTPNQLLADAVYDNADITAMYTALTDEAVSQTTQEWYPLVGLHASGSKNAPRLIMHTKTGARPNGQDERRRMTSLIDQMNLNRRFYDGAGFYRDGDTISPIPDQSIWGTLDTLLYLDPMAYWSPVLSRYIGPQHEAMINSQADQLIFKPADPSETNDVGRWVHYCNLERIADTHLITIFTKTDELLEIISRPPDQQPLQDWTAIYELLPTIFEAARDETIYRTASAKMARYTTTYCIMQAHLQREHDRICIYKKLRNVRPLFGHWMRWAWPAYKCIFAHDVTSLISHIDLARQYTPIYTAAGDPVDLTRPPGHPHPIYDLAICTTYAYNTHPTVREDPAESILTSRFDPPDNVVLPVGHFLDLLQKAGPFVPLAHTGAAEAAPPPADGGANSNMVAGAPQLTGGASTTAAAANPAQADGGASSAAANPSVPNGGATASAHQQPPPAQNGGALPNQATTAAGPAVQRNAAAPLYPLLPPDGATTASNGAADPPLAGTMHQTSQQVSGQIDDLSTGTVLPDTVVASSPKAPAKTVTFPPNLGTSAAA